MIPEGLRAALDARLRRSGDAVAEREADEAELPVEVARIRTTGDSATGPLAPLPGAAAAAPRVVWPPDTSDKFCEARPIALVSASSGASERLVSACECNQ